MTLPKVIYAWRFIDAKVLPEVQGGWTEHAEKRLAPFIALDAPELVALVEALRAYKAQSRRIPFNTAMDADRAISAWEALTNGK